MRASRYDERAILPADRDGRQINKHNRYLYNASPGYLACSCIHSLSEMPSALPVLSRPVFSCQLRSRSDIVFLLSIAVGMLSITLS